MSRRLADDRAASGGSVAMLRGMASFQRPKPRTAVIVSSIIGIAVVTRYWVYTQSRSALETADAMAKQKLQAALIDDERRRRPDFDWDRVMQGVLAEEARIADEEAQRLR